MFLFTSIIIFLLALSNIRFISSTPILPEVYDQIPAAQHLNLTSAFIKRQPPNNMCDAGDQWLGRFCDGSVNPRAYRDICHDDDPQHPFDYWTETEDCPQDTECMDTIDLNEAPNVACIPTPQSASSSSPDRQDGKIVFQIGYGGSGWVAYPVVVAQPMEAATFTAHLDGMLKSEELSCLILFI